MSERTINLSDEIRKWAETFELSNVEGFIAEKIDPAISRELRILIVAEFIAWFREMLTDGRGPWFQFCLDNGGVYVAMKTQDLFDDDEGDVQDRGAMPLSMMIDYFVQDWQDDRDGRHHLMELQRALTIAAEEIGKHLS